MKKIRYQISTIDPVIISSESGNQFMVPTKDFIPGSIILGALAAKYIAQNKSADQKFYDLFINGKVNFANAYIRTKVGENENSTYPIPYSIQHVKNNDTVIYDLLYETADEQTKTFNGYGFINNEDLIKINIKKSTEPHHERDYETGSTKAGVFFNYEAINAGQSFEGSIWGEDRFVDEFYKLFSMQNELRIGRSRSTEYGKVSISFSASEFCTSNDFEMNTDGTVSLSFLSNVIIYDRNGFASSDIEILTDYLKEKISAELIVEKSFIRTEEIENYVSVWKLKKPSEISFKAGSCFLLKVDAKDKNKLIALQNEGIGERKHEGFGRIAFGMQKKSKIKKAIINKVPSLKPADTIVPNIVKTKISTLVGQYLRKITAVKALEIVKLNSAGLEKKITSSQIGRLEGIARISVSDTDFKKKVSSLRKTSKDKLINCHFAKSNLLVFLTESDLFNDNSISSGVKKVEELFSDTGMGGEILEQIKSGLYQTHYLNLFSAMRKAIKGGQKL